MSGAKTQSELSILVTNGRIPPFPRGCSQSLFGVIKGMLSLNPTMRPSTQLLQHERSELVRRLRNGSRSSRQSRTRSCTASVMALALLGRILTLAAPSLGAEIRGVRGWCLRTTPAGPTKAGSWAPKAWTPATGHRRWSRMLSELWILTGV
ncbi:hypothetical protein D9611_010686 [Ephemerocybe angulata]|uniref:Uncharacterized protein n=1 Tax=Ephemerocybe angulata TaxID=980116 RepID=A0A8H5BBZ5_9AGAR|nr:hypothetical protein D9611_010686 [Tulosesus angulatus]